MSGVAGTVRSTTWVRKSDFRNRWFPSMRETKTRGYPAPTFSVVSAKQGIVEMPGMVASGDNWAEHGFPWVKLGLGKSWWPHSVHNTRSSVI